jgi:hypothetical protein
MKHFVLGLSMATLVMSMSAAQAGGDHGHGHNDEHSSHDMKNHDDKGMAHKKDGMFIKEEMIDGYKVSFHIMKAKPGKAMGGSHDFMIKIEKDGKVLKNVAINTKVVHPNGKAESKRVMKMGDWNMAGYDLGHKGNHQVMILFKTSDGQKHKGGIYY